MKVVYIAHPISGNVEDNLLKIREIVRYINRTEANVVPFVPYYVDCVSLDDSNEWERDRGIKNDHELLSRGFIDEMWLFGSGISRGMAKEIELARKYSIQVFPMTVQTAMAFEEIIK